MTYLSSQTEQKGEFIRRLFLENPNISIAEAARQSGASKRYVERIRVELQNGIDFEQLMTRAPTERERAIAASSSGSASLFLKRSKVETLVVQNPFMTNAEIAKRSKTSVSFVANVVTELIEGGFYRGLEREIQLEEYLDKNPDASYEDAAEHFNVPLWQILYTLRGFEWDADRPEEAWENNTIVDEEMWKRRCLRPEWYVKEVCGAGYLGVELPEEEFKIYLELREKKRQKGVMQSHLPLCLMDGRIKKNDEYID